VKDLILNWYIIAEQAWLAHGNVENKMTDDLLFSSQVTNGQRAQMRLSLSPGTTERSG